MPRKDSRLKQEVTAPKGGSPVGEGVGVPADPHRRGAPWPAAASASRCSWQQPESMSQGVQREDAASSGEGGPGKSQQEGFQEKSGS